jgi:hypothetical protein
MIRVVERKGEYICKTTRIKRNVIRRESKYYLPAFWLNSFVNESFCKEGNSSSVNQEIPPDLWNPQIYYHVNPMLKHINNVHSCPPKLLSNSILLLPFHLGLGLRNGLFLTFPYQNAVFHLSFPPYVSSAHPISTFYTITLRNFVVPKRSVW